MSIDSAGTVVWSAQYTAFGQAQIQSETVTNNLRFPGQYFDVETGLHYNWHRYYDPTIGRYLQTDPLGFDGGDANWTRMFDDHVCGAGCAPLAVTYAAGARLDVQALPDAGSVFVRWETADGQALENVYDAAPGATVCAVFEEQ